MITKETAKNILNRYLELIKSGTVMAAKDGGLVISLPFTLMSGHFVELRVKELLADHIGFSDMNNVLADLWLSGLKVTPQKKAMVKEIVKEFNLRWEGEEIVAEASMEEAPEVLHRFIQACLRAGDLNFFHRLSVVKEPPIAKHFRKILTAQNIKFIGGPAAVIRGEERKHKVDYIIRKNEHPQVVKALDRQTYLEELLEAWAFKFDDIWKKDPKVSRFCLYNPENESWTDEHTAFLVRHTEGTYPITEAEGLVGRLRTPFI